MMAMRGKMAGGCASVQLISQPTPASSAARGHRRVSPWRGIRHLCLCLLPGALAMVIPGLSVGADVKPVALRAEYLIHPQGLDTASPRLQWRLESTRRGVRQTAYQILVASSEQRLARGVGDLWDTGKVTSDATTQIAYTGKPLVSGQRCHWKVRSWDERGRASAWSEPAHWSMGLLRPEDWQAEWISFRDDMPLHTDRESLFLPPARHYRKSFTAAKPVKRAMLYFSALGLAEFHLNGERVGDAWFEPGWADYPRRAYYRTHDVTRHLVRGDNCLGAIVAEGWYSGYVGYGVWKGYGPNRVGRYFYGKTPALLAQLEIEYADGSCETVITDSGWQVSADGPIREADLIMGEAHDARRDDPQWCVPAARMRHGRSPSPTWRWESAIPAADNGRLRATSFDNRGEREVELGFQRPLRLQAYAAPPIRVTQELKTQRITEPQPGVYIFDLGQNFAGNIRLRVKGEAGQKLQLRFGEMLHDDGRLMTENLRKARATDFYTLRGDPDGEAWSPQFTYHGFQYVEVTGLTAKPSPDMITGLVLHNDTPLTSEFACSDEVMTRFWKNTQWTQRANFIEVPTDCPQRDERLGWLGDAQVYVRTASYNADVAAFFTKWLDDLVEAQLESGAYPDYAPYPMGHGPRAQWGAAWTDAGIICPYTIWQVYGDTRVIERMWPSMTRFMEWRRSRAPDFRGRNEGNTWGDWLNVNEPTPIEFIDAAYFKLGAGLMADMARAIGREREADDYARLSTHIATQFARDYLEADGRLKVPTQTAHVLALDFGLLPESSRPAVGSALAQRIAGNDFRMATGFLGTKPLLPVLSANGHHDLAVRLFQSRRFPSWGYAVVNGANSVWERWDSYTKEHGFNGASGRQNAAMNSFSHYAFGAAMEWGFRTLAGIDTDGPGFKRIVIRPLPPTPGGHPGQQPIAWVHAHYDSIHGRIVSRWRQTATHFELEVVIPPNTTARVHLPGTDARGITVDGKPVSRVAGIETIGIEHGTTVLHVGSGRYRFLSVLAKHERRGGIASP